jgi:hypothetical protein
MATGTVEFAGSACYIRRHMHVARYEDMHVSNVDINACVVRAYLIRFWWNVCSHVGT